MRADRAHAPSHARSTSSEQILSIINSKIRGGVGQIRVTKPYEESGAIYRLVNVISGALVDGELGVYKKSRTKGVADQKVESGPAFDLIEHPTGMEDPSGDGDQVILTKEDWIQVIAGRAMLGRSAGCLILGGKLSDKPIKLLPLPGACSLRALRPANDPWTLVGWQATLGGQTFFLRPKEAVRFTFALDLDDPLDGVGPGIPAQTSVDTREAALRYNKHALENGGSLGGILQFDEDVELTDPQVAEIRRRFEERHMGLSNAERLAVLTGKFKFVETGKSAKDMQYGTTIDKSLEDIARPFGAPLLFLGVADHSALARATVLVEKGLLYHGTVIPFAKRIASTLTRVVRRFDPELYCWWDFSQVEALKEDESDRILRAKGMRELGFTLAAIEKKYEFGVELPAHADANLVPANLIPIEMAIEGAGVPMGTDPLMPEPATPAPAPTASVDQVKAITELVEKVKSGTLPRDSGIELLKLLGLDDARAEAIMASAGSAAPAPSAAVTSPAGLLEGPQSDPEARSLTRAQVDRRTRAWRAYVRKVDPYENAIKGAYRKFLNAMRAKVLKALEEKTRAFTRADGEDQRAQEIANEFDVDAFLDALGTSIENAYLAGARQSGKELADLGIANDVVLEANKGRLPKLAESYWEQRANVTGKTGQRIKQEIADAILEGLTNEEGQTELADRVRDVFKANLREYDVRRVARTEAHIAVSNGRFEQMKSQGVKKHEWLCVAGDTLLAGPGVTHVARRRHTGRWAVLRTGGGRVVTVTADHKVLTRRGWVEAQFVVEGDDLVNYVGQPEVAAGVVPDVEHVPSTVEQIFDAAYELAAPAGMVARVVNLDSEGRECEVEVVLVDGELRDRLQPPRSERIRNQLLEISDLALADLLAAGTAGKLDAAECGAPVSVEMRGALPPELGTHEPSPQDSGVGAIADGNAGESQGLPDHQRGSAPPAAEREQGGAASVFFGYDRCVGVNIETRTGHAFDYTTATGWMVANGLVVHNSAKDDHVRESHENVDGQIVEIGETFENGLRYPGDPAGDPSETINCVLPGTFISGRPQVILRSLYAGEVVEIETRRGNRVTVTVNHPVLTDKGIVPAHALKVGDHVIGERAQIEGGSPGRQPQHEQGKARIEDVFDAFAAHGSGWSYRARPFDFDGDGRFLREKVDFVEVLDPLPPSLGPTRDAPVMADAEAAFGQNVAQLDLETAGVPRAMPGALVSGSADRSPSLRELPLDRRAVFAHRAPLEGLGFGSATRLESVPAKHRRDHRPVTAVALGQREDGLARQVSAYDVRLAAHRQRALRIGDAAQLDAVLPENARHDLVRNAEFCRELAAGSAGEVAPDEIVHLRRFEYVGHVYDLQDERGWFNSGGVLSRNCRCVALPVAEDVEQFAEETDRAAHLDYAETDLCVRHSSDELARRAIELGIAPTVRAIAKAVPRVLAQEARRLGASGSALDVLREHLPSMTKNAAVAGAVRELGGTLFASIWSRAFDLEAA